MRIDAKNLLDRLGRNDFAYREFEDRFSDLELWPILEALLRDPRLQSAGQTHEPKTNDADLIATEVVPTPSIDNSNASMFSRYGHSASAADAPVERRATQDVRMMLRNLSNSGSQGDA